MMKIPDEILSVAARLGDLRSKVVFVGGMVRGPLVTDPAVDGPRPTKDVDVILDIPGLAEFEEFCASLRQLGFREDLSENAPICRYTLRDPPPGAPNPPVDFMPLDPAILGFSNVWYLDAFQSSVNVETNAGVIRLIDAPCFVATKLESFASRGGGEYYHHDLEDFVVLVDGRPSLVSELGAASNEVRDFVVEEVTGLLSDQDFLDSLPGHLSPDEASQQRLPLILSRLREIAALRTSADQSGAAPRPPTRAAKAPMTPPQPSRAGATAALEGAGTDVWRPARSTNIAIFAYHAGSRILTVQFKGGGVYEYYDVPQQVFQAWTTAASAGRYHHRWIRGRYRYRRVYG
jgi:hypothetical protein